MQAVERGILRLDDPVGDLVPELSNLSVIDGTEGGVTRLRKAKCVPEPLRQESSLY